MSTKSFTRISSMLLLSIVAGHGCNSEVEFAGQSLDKAEAKVVLDQEFAAGLIGDGRVVYEPLYGQAREVLTLREKPVVTSTLRQVERQVKVDEFTQGHDGETLSEEFEISAAGKLDLLIVVDNSNSMETEQNNLATRLSSLTKHLKSVDWRIGVVTTDSPALRNGGKPIKATDPNGDTDFFNAVNVGTGGSGDEKGIKQAYSAFADCSNPAHPWLRADASLAVMFLSDEEYAGGRFDPTADQLIARMEACRPKAKLKAYAMTWTSACPKDGGETPGTDYLKVVTAFGGVSDLICQSDYKQTLERISLDVSRSVQREFSLKHEPVGGSLSLEVDGQPYADFEVLGKKLLLKNADGSLIRLKVVYRHDAKPKFDRVSLATAASPETIQVFVGGVEIPTDKVTYDDLLKEIFFVDMPPDKAKIRIKYRTKGTLAKDFPLGAVTPVGNVLDVAVNGVPATDWELDDATRVLSFTEPPEDGAAIALTIRLVDSRITHYAVGAQQSLDAALDVAVKDKATGEPLSVSFEGSDVIFAEPDVVDGREVEIVYNYGDAGTVLTHELPDDPIAGTVVVTGHGSRDCVEQVKTEGRVVTFTCDASELAEVEISYQYVAELYTTFVVEGSVPAEAEIRVFVDGGAITSWVRNGNVIEIPAGELGPRSKVRIIGSVN